ncbi:MAG: sigma-54 dependent transcriptional regulator, partial [Planctomycetota bacterium]
MVQLLGFAEKVARTDLAVLISGESGAGKEVLARRIHELSTRSGGPFVAQNCAAIPESLLESEFFGHVRGAFTGADQSNDGVFARADGGTLFLDEIGDMPVHLQAKILRVLDDGEVRPVGGSTSYSVNLRIVCATHQDLGSLVREGKFREDLYYRLAGATLTIPPLRSRPSDIDELALHFVEELNRDRGTNKRLGEGFRSSLLQSSWPGNVRELKNRITLFFHLAESDEIRGDELVLQPQTSLVRAKRLVNAVAPMSEIEREAIRLALVETAGDCAEAANLLELSRSTIYTKIKKYGLQCKARKWSQ